MPAQSSSWKGPLLTSDVANQLKTALFGARNPQPSYEAETLMAEALRIAIWALNVLKQDPLHTGTAATTRRVLAHARAIWEPLREKSNEHATQQSEQAIGDNVEEADLERDALKALEEQCDAFSLPGGFWLPAPLRLVSTTGTEHLLVGGLPTHLLPPTMLEHIRLHGSFRQIDTATFPGPLPTSTYIRTWQFQSQGDWLGPRPITLEQHIQDFHMRELLPVNLDTASQSLEAYAAYLDKPQAQRWVSFDMVRDGRYLLRTQMLWGKRQYSVGQVEQHRLVRQNYESPSTDIRRLCYALDREAKTPTRVVQGRSRIILRSELPARERKQMMAIGNLRIPQEGYYPREWIGITPQQMSIVHDMLQQLGIRIETGNNR
jgi:hypothetical protein